MPTEAALRLLLDIRLPISSLRLWYGISGETRAAEPAFVCKLTYCGYPADRMALDPCQCATEPRIPEQTAGRVGRRVDFRLRGWLQVNEAWVMSFLLSPLHGRRVRVRGFATSASPVPGTWAWRGIASRSGGWRQTPQCCGIGCG